ncbi:glutamine-hydrolyzing carbamoyl-phosphate synthase small subunit [Tumebacillus sp. ITR2]|uniref:Carbamoyl phosphate synthase small chain n=1 Tax=Tumebacillus amylolyticus TaxID=2801339 RepID=A0ABS1J9N9_9BACL|nr:carbamoyl phosphate synthase small subunit [Tumebacillus amylolyticus]MBL0386991.1 glutamine-hydrolyzing carbamoyl-phosphate synthase small subunit [Tumebacillus amylolyticus]
MKGYLVLENGHRFSGELIGAVRRGYGEVVFHTGMTGYQEILTDPSYANQIVVMTYPLIGNYGINAEDFEAKKPWLTGFITSDACSKPSHNASEKTLHTYLEEQGIVGLTGVDTRSLVRMIRQHGSLKGYIVSGAEIEMVDGSFTFPDLPRDLVKKVTTPVITQHTAEGEHHVVLLDFGAKGNIANSLAAHGCRVTVVPATTSLEIIRALQPDGIMLSNGPGDPQDNLDLLPTIRALGEEFPVFGICLGHQLIGLAYGAKTHKMKFGHRGSNHPVKDLRTGKVHITSQNHGYTVDDATLPSVLEVTHVNVNDGTVEGVRHRTLPVFSVQYHPEAAPGPEDARELFVEFTTQMNERKGHRLVYAT